MNTDDSDRTKDGYESVHYRAPDGLKLHFRDYGRNTATYGRLPVVCLPGLTRNSQDFHRIALRMSESADAPRRVVSFDYRGRGCSEWDGNRNNYNILTEAEDVLAGCTVAGIEHAIFLGTSRGVLIIHVLAASRPTILKAAIFNDAGPAIDGAGLAQIKAYHDRHVQPQSMDDAAAILKSVHGSAFPALGDEDWRDYAEATFTEKDGKLTGNFDPAIASMLRDIDLNTPLPTMWPQFEGLADIPLLTLRGENSILLTEETVAEMHKRHPSMQRVTVPGQGHAPVLHTGDLPETITRFAKSIDS
jgi:pimeloyl-ACP methyl ester carboxylesterase